MPRSLLTDLTALIGYYLFRKGSRAGRYPRRITIGRGWRSVNTRLSLLSAGTLNTNVEFGQICEMMEAVMKMRRVLL